MSEGSVDVAEVMRQFEELAAKARDRRWHAERAAVIGHVVAIIEGQLLGMATILLILVANAREEVGQLSLTMFIDLARDVIQAFNGNPAGRLLQSVGWLVILTVMNVIFLGRSIKELRLSLASPTPKAPDGLTEPGSVSAAQARPR